MRSVRLAFCPVPRRLLIAGPWLAVLCLVTGAGPAAAHGPTRQKVSEQVSIAAPADKVWAVVGAFGGLKDWHPGVAESSADKGNEVGSLRTARLRSGASLVEALETYDAAGMRLSHRQKAPGGLPVTNYAANLVVRAEGAGTVVEWRGAFYRGFPNNDPPPDQNDEAALAAVTAFYREGLAGLKARLERP